MPWGPQFRPVRQSQRRNGEIICEFHMLVETETILNRIVPGEIHTFVGKIHLKIQ